MVAVHLLAFLLHRLNVIIMLYYFRFVAVHLPADAQQNICRFRWWQPVHSGYGLDVWALDEVAATTKLYNTIQLDFSNENEVQMAADVHLGELQPYCGQTNAFRLVSPSRGAAALLWKNQCV